MTEKSETSTGTSDEYDLPEVTIQLHHTHPLYLHPNDNPNMALVTEVLSDLNYTQWNISMTISLSAKNKLGLHNGKHHKPTITSKYYTAWERCNIMLISWILNSVCMEIKQSITYIPTAQEMWEDLQLRFSQSDMPKIFKIRQSIGMCNQGSLSINGYFTKFKGLWDELSNLVQMPKCSCTCTYGAAKDHEEYDDLQKMTQFLMGLSDSYTDIRGQILRMTHLPPMSKVVNMLAQEEGQRLCSSNPNMINLQDNPTAIYIKTQGEQSQSRNFKNRTNDSRSTNQFKGKVFCEYCHGDSHNKYKCFHLHGYPEWHKLYGTKPDPSRMPKNYRSRMQGNGKTQVKSNDVSNEVSVQGGESNVFTADQYQQLLSMINNTSAGQILSGDGAMSGNYTCTNFSSSMNPACLITHVFSGNDWVIDTRATDHITNSFKILMNPTKINSYINLPNGRTSCITHKGSVNISPELRLKDVLYVPDFKFNFLSGSKLAKDNKCMLMFNANTCLYRTL